MNKSGFERYQGWREKHKEKINKQIEKEYIKLYRKGYSKGFIICSLQLKFRNANGQPFSHTKIYSALNLRDIHKKVKIKNKNLSGSAGVQPWM